MLVSGDPGATGELAWRGNGGPGSTTAALFPQDPSAALELGVPNTSAIFGRAGAIVSLTRQPDGSVLISCAGLAATTHSIQATTSLESPGLADTLPSSTSSDGNGLFTFNDLSTPPATRFRFYRTVTLLP